MATITGTTGNDNLTDTIGGANYLEALDGNDTLDGGTDNDTLDGGTGSDTMSGGTGADRYLIDGTDVITGESAPGASGWFDQVELSGSTNATLTMANNVERFDATAFTGNLTLTGNDAATNYIHGGGGNDSLNGGSGIDVIYAGNGNDTLNGSSGESAYLSGGAGDDVYVIEEAHTLIGATSLATASAPAAVLLMDTGGTNDTLAMSDINATDIEFGLSANGLFIFEEATDHVLAILPTFFQSAGRIENFDFLDQDFTSVSNTTLAGMISAYNSGLNSSGGSSGSDSVTLSGSASLAGLAGHDVINGGDDGNLIYGDLAPEDTGYADTVGADHLYGRLGNDTLIGGPGWDNLDGEQGDDVLFGGGGNYADYLTGGVGSDTYIFGEGGLGTRGVIIINEHDATNDGTDTLVLEGLTAYDVDLESQDYTSLVTAANYTEIDGLSKLVISVLGTDERVDIIGQFGGYDGYTGAASSDQLHRIEEFEFADGLVWDGADITAYLADPGNVATTGNDSIDGSSGNDGVFLTLASGMYSFMDVSNANHAIDGNAGDDSISGLAGHDFLVGGDGSDTVLGGDGNDMVIGHGLLMHSSGAYTIPGADGADSLTGGAGNDTMYGGEGSDSIYGNNANDTLAGDNGNDYLYGGLGADVLTGGAGGDRFNFNSAFGSVDTITDFDTTHTYERIRLDDADFTSLSSATWSSGKFVTGTAAADTDDYIIYNTTTGELYYDADANGSGAQVQFASLTGAATLTWDDIVIY